MKLYTKILIGMVAGIAVGWILHTTGLEDLTKYTDYIGELFIRLIKMVVVPLVLASLILGAANLGRENPGRVGSLSAKALGFFMMTTVFSVSIGVGLANMLAPGDHLPAESRDALIEKYADDTTRKLTQGDGTIWHELGQVTDLIQRDASNREVQADAQAYRERVEKNYDEATRPAKDQRSEFEKVLDVLVRMAPTNPIQSLSQGDMLAIIFFSLFFGIALALVLRSDPDAPEDDDDLRGSDHPRMYARALLHSIGGLNEVVIKMVNMAMEIAPYGVFALMTGVVATMGLDILLPLAYYGAVVVLGLFLHATFTYGSLLIFYVRINPLRFLRAIKEALLLGFSTSSSSATLPVSMRVSRENLGISNEVSSFVLPLGATVNMDGTALYQGVAAIFIAQVYGMDLSFSQQLVMILTATLASIGAAGVPGAGMITLAIVLDTANVDAAGIALIFGLDRLLDMFRTSVNIIGDLTCTSVMATSEGEKIEAIDHDARENA
ncbi:MAG: dicarboxylate/amino acid:cation symporter [bacterium]|nr:dicarboxylate/amino acid:cation symporter [bacterium]